MANARSAVQLLQEFGVEETKGSRGQGFEDSSKMRIQNGLCYFSIHNVINNSECHSRNPENFRESGILPLY